VGGGRREAVEKASVRPLEPLSPGRVGVAGASPQAKGSEALQQGAVAQLTREQMRALADSLRRVGAAVEAGELDCSPAMRHRLDGAVAALEVALGHGSDSLAELTKDDPAKPS